MLDFPGQARQIGLLAFLGERPLGLDVIGCTTLYGSVHERLIRGYVVDALGVRGDAKAPGEEQAQIYLRRVNTARRVVSPTVGVGGYAVLAGGVIGGELSAGRRLVHLSAFPAVEPGSSYPEGYAGEPISPPSRRGRRFE